MSATVRQPCRTQTAVSSPSATEPLDYCLCGRGPVVGVVTYTSSRMWFFPLGSRTGDDAERAAELACLDCVADTAADVASGSIRNRMHAEAVKQHAQKTALVRRSQISVADHPRQTSPETGDQMT
ncbi:hypothetical protein ABZ383_32095 [Streptomyces sp. NPDC005900]|uniref:hypothetical protein n=1 Tax=Streptomyces sp. NPDC005900 TaxID=3154569 RepID=UPI0033C26455